MKIAMLALSAAVLAAPGIATAQTQTTGQQQAAVTQSYQEIDDAHLLDAQGNRIGEIEDVLIDANGGIAYVVEFDEGFLGLNEHEVIVPAERLTFDAGTGSFTTDMAEADLKALPEWDD